MSSISCEAAKRLDSILKQCTTKDVQMYIEHHRLNPKEGLRYCDFSGFDFGEADVAGWNLSCTLLSNADLSRVRNIDRAIFDEHTDLTAAKLPPGITMAQLMKR